MAFIGKLLVVVHAAASLTVLTWAFGIYTQRIDWNNPKPREGQAARSGLYEQQKAQADLFNTNANKAYYRWASNLNQVEALERERFPRRDFYQKELDTIRRGTGTLKELAIDPRTGFLDISPTAARKDFIVRESKMSGDPTGVLAQSIATYENMMKKTLEDIEASIARNQKAIEERDQLNREIIDVTDPVFRKGLRTLIAEQQEIRDAATAENAYVAGFVTNREAEFGLLRKRRDAMLARIDEIKKWLAGMK